MCCWIDSWNAEQARRYDRKSPELQIEIYFMQTLLIRIIRDAQLLSWRIATP